MGHANSEPSEISTRDESAADAAAPGSRSSLQLVAVDESGLAVFPLPSSGSVQIGRGGECEIRLNDALVSRRHALLHLEPLSLEDCGSANGTFVGAEAVSGGARVGVRLGQPITVGRITMVIRRGRPGSGLQPVAVRRSTTDATLPVVRDERMKELYATVERLARGRISLLILGETGVGKEVVAEAVHRASPRSDGPLLRLNCASLSEALLESELFGHERGAFTGASAVKPGLIEQADGGTVFLDEIAELSPHLQAKLLRVLETRELTRVGGLRQRRVDVRFVCATNRDLENEVREGAFRADLLFRLKGAVLVVPPLRERRSEILPIAEACLERAAEHAGLRAAPLLSAEARARLLDHAWPGNVRELLNVIERAVLLCSGSTIRAEDLALGPAETAAPGEASLAARDAGVEGERERIARVLLECGGNQTRAAEALGIPRRTLVRRIATLGLPRPRQSESERPPR